LITVGLLIAYLLGLPLPDCDQKVDKCFDENDIPLEGKNPYKPGFIGDEYWRVLFAFPILTAIL